MLRTEVAELDMPDAGIDPFQQVLIPCERMTPELSALRFQLQNVVSVSREFLLSVSGKTRLALLLKFYGNTVQFLFGLAGSHPFWRSPCEFKRPELVSAGIVSSCHTNAVGNDLAVFVFAGRNVCHKGVSFRDDPERKDA